MESSYDGKGTPESGKYLLYAIGEIVLVVIGILIALHLPAGRQGSTNGINKESTKKKRWPYFKT